MTLDPAADSPRVRVLRDVPPRAGGAYVLYWMVAARRARWNHGLDRAVSLARELGRPLVVLEALRRGYRWRSERIDRFVIAGMADNAAAFAAAGICHHPYVEPQDGAGRGLLETLARDACAVVTDDFPCFFLPRMVAAAARKVTARMEAVDSNGLLPLAATTSDFATAYAFRRFLQKTLPPHLARPPKSDPFDGLRLPRAPRLPDEILARWPAATLPAPANTARRALDAFLARGLDRYAEERNDPDADATSGLSPFLHFGHVASHEVVDRILRAQEWSPGRLAAKCNGRREGWWGLSGAAEGFLDQIVTWRELGFVFAHHRADHDRYESLPEWAQRTLAKHADDPRPHVYSLGELDAARTHDPLWNAAQTQLVREGRMHNYLRMLWGKKIVEWSRTPREALDAMIELNNAHALDGRDPNSYSGIFWTLGRFDRPWGPERPIFGTVRFMSSANTARKLSVTDYLRRWAPGTSS